MYDTHTTRDGDTLLICQMDDAHLHNTIRYHARTMQQAQAVLQNASAIDPMTQVLSGISSESFRRKAQDAIKHAHELLQPYIAEASLRGLAIAPILQSAYGRSGAVPRFMPQLESLEPVDDDDDLNDWED